jgi:hypothetical protein
MVFHRTKFGIMSDLHDLTCKGSKDYKQAFERVQDFNMTKILSKQSSFPDLNGDFKNNKVEILVLQAIQKDIDLYNFIDSLFRRNNMDVLHEYMH